MCFAMVSHQQAGVWAAEVAQGQERGLGSSHLHNSRQPQQVFLLKPYTFQSQVTVRCLTEETATGMLSRGHILIKAGIYKLLVVVCPCFEEHRMGFKMEISPGDTAHLNVLIILGHKLLPQLACGHN